jgi:hypothetical protein
MGGVTERREPSETERLLAEVDGMLAGAPTRPVAVVDEPGAGPLRSRLRAALLVGAVCGAGVWVLFALLPFLAATSGGLGAFLAATATTLAFRRRPRG